MKDSGWAAPEFAVARRLSFFHAPGENLHVEANADVRHLQAADRARTGSRDRADEPLHGARRGDQPVWRRVSRKGRAGEPAKARQLEEEPRRRGDAAGPQPGSA